MLTAATPHPLCGGPGYRSFWRRRAEFNWDYTSPRRRKEASPLIGLKPQVMTQSFLQQLPTLRQTLMSGATPMTWEDGQRYYLLAVETLESYFSNLFENGAWYDQLYSAGYWAVRNMTGETTRPSPLLRAEVARIIRWLDEIERELKRISEQDEWDDSSTPRLVFDTSALVREGSFDQFDWSKLVDAESARLVIPILVVRELDDLKNYGRSEKARPRLRKIMRILDGKGRGPAMVSASATLELLMDPPGHVRLPSHDEEIVRRAAYLQGRRGGPLKLITGDYTMLFTAEAHGVRAQLTPAEVASPPG